MDHQDHGTKTSIDEVTRQIGIVLGRHPGYTLQSWGGAYEACANFLDRWADEAVALGWTTLDVFGVHPEAGTIRPDFCGALVLGTERVSEIAETRMQFVNTTYYRNTPGRPTGAVPLWRFGQ